MLSAARLARALVMVGLGHGPVPFRRLPCVRMCLSPFMRSRNSCEDQPFVTGDGLVEGFAHQVTADAGAEVKAFNGHAEWCKEKVQDDGNQQETVDASIASTIADALAESMFTGVNPKEDTFVDRHSLGASSVRGVSQRDRDWRRHEQRRHSRRACPRLQLMKERTVHMVRWTRNGKNW